MEEAIREMARVIKPNGRALILVTNTYSLLHNILLAYKKGQTVVDRPTSNSAVCRPPRVDRYPASAMGLRVIHTNKYEIETPRHKKDWLAYLRHPKKLVRLALRPFVPTNLAFCFVFTCHKV